MACDNDTLMLLSRYADGEATPNEAARATRHLERCTECRDLVSEWQDSRQVLVWAHTHALPDVDLESLESLEARIREEAAVTTVEKSPARAVKPKLRWPRLAFPAFTGRSAFAWAGGLAVAGAAAFIIYHAATLPPMLRVATTGQQTPLVRVQPDVLLELAPNTRIKRLGERDIRLESGWLRATVRHGDGLRIRTGRLDVRDLGTRFQVRAGREADTVLVEEGSVSVQRRGKSYRLSASQTLTAPEKGNPVVAAFPAYESGEDDTGIPLGKEEPFHPQTGGDLDWLEGQKALAARFPEIHCNGASLGDTQIDKLAYINHLAVATGLRRGLRAHLPQLAQMFSGGPADPQAWEIPVGVLQTNGMSGPFDLAADTYYIRLCSTGRGLAWRLTGATGAGVKVPAALGAGAEVAATLGRMERVPRASYSKGGLTVSSGGIEYQMAFSQEQPPDYTLRLLDWPGPDKPVLRFQMKGMPVPESRREADAMKAELARQVGGVPGLDLEHGSQTLLYLDPDRRHRMLVAWNGDAGRGLADALNGKGNAPVLAGAVLSDVAWAQPTLPAGAYLLWWIPQSSGAPRWKVTSPDGQVDQWLPSPPPGERNPSYNGYGWRPPEPTNSHVGLRFATGEAQGDRYPFRFLAERPTATSSAINGWTMEGWGEGRMELEKP